MDALTLSPPPLSHTHSSMVILSVGALHSLPDQKNIALQIPPSSICWQSTAPLMCPDRQACGRAPPQGPVITPGGPAACCCVETSPPAKSPQLLTYTCSPASIHTAVSVSPPGAFNISEILLKNHTATKPTEGAGRGGHEALYNRSFHFTQSLSPTRFFCL